MKEIDWNFNVNPISEMIHHIRSCPLCKGVYFPLPFYRRRIYCNKQSAGATFDTIKKDTLENTLKKDKMTIVRSPQPKGSPACTYGEYLFKIIRVYENEQNRMEQPA